MERTKASVEDLARIAASHAGLPDEYFVYMATKGWGDTPSGCMIYSGPLDPQEVFGCVVYPTSVLLLGDDYSGYCLGFDFAAATYGEFSPDAEWQPWPATRHLDSYTGD